MLLPQIQILQFDHEICRWDTTLITSPHVRFKFLNSFEKMVNYANVWLTATEDEPGMIFLSGHGLPSGIYTQNSIVGIDQVLRSLHPLSKKTIHFSSCYTLNTEDAKLKKLYKSSGAHIISGYQKSVNTGLSAKLESFLINRMQHPISTEYVVTKAYGELYRRKPKAIETSGFCFVSRILIPNKGIG